MCQANTITKHIKGIAKPIVDKNDNVIFDYNGDKLTAVEIVSQYLSDPLNANLLRSKMRSGNGTDKSNVLPVGTITSREQLKGMKPEEINAAFESGLLDELLGAKK